MAKNWDFLLFWIIKRFKDIVRSVPNVIIPRIGKFKFSRFRNVSIDSSR